MPSCNVCGTEYDEGDWRCEGEFPDGTRCGADLVGQSSGDGSPTVSRRGA